MIFIPSYKRAQDCKAAKWISEAVICCHKFEAGEYKKHNKNKIMTIPDELGGKGMARIRNWIIDNAKDEKVLMIDDDVRNVGYYENEIEKRFTEEELYSFVEMGFRMCREAGTVLWGLNLLVDRKAYREYSPFSFTSVVLGPFFGVVRKGLRFDERLGLKEDFDYSIQVLNEYRRILRFNKYHYHVGHLVGQGGCTAYRSSAKEKRQKEIMLKKWGKKIVQFRRGKTDPMIRVPISGM